MDLYLRENPHLKREQIQEVFKNIEFQIGDEFRCLDEDEFHDTYEESFKNKYGQIIGHIGMVTQSLNNMKDKVDAETILLEYQNYITDKLQIENGARIEQDEERGEAKLILRLNEKEITPHQNDIHLIVAYILQTA